MRRYYLDRDMLEVKDGSFFQIVGNIHPSKRVIAFPKYVHDNSGYWFKNNIFYKRVFPYYSAVKTYEACRNLYPQYLVYDKILGIRIFEVPKEDVKNHYVPEVRLREIIERPTDRLEELTYKLIDVISDVSGLSSKVFGVTGSILLKIHNIERSDLDLTVYGKENSLVVKETLLNLINNEKHGFKRLHGSILSDYAKKLSLAHPISYNEAVKLYTKIFWGRALFKNKFFSMHPVPMPSEISIKYGDQIYRGMGMIEIKCVVSDNSESMYTPAIYKVEKVKILRGKLASDIGEIEEVVSYEGIYADIANINDTLRVYGKLEKVYDKRKKIDYYRVVVGTIEAAGKDYIKIIS